MPTVRFFELPIYLLLIIIFLLIIFFCWLGYSYKKRQSIKYPEEKIQSVKIVEGIVFSMLSLLMGFTFSVAIGKFETQRRVLVQEATYIRTAVLRSGMYPDSVHHQFQKDFKDYIEARIFYYTSPNSKTFIERTKQAMIISDRIWRLAIEESRKSTNFARTGQMIPALNNMMDIVTTREAERESHVPTLVLWVLLTFIVLGAFLLGADVSGRTRKRLPIFAYAFVMSLTLNLIIELSQPSTGLINFDAIQRRFVDLRELVK
jgi:hypothetical protein